MTKAAGCEAAPALEPVIWQGRPLQDLGFPSRWTIERQIERGTFPSPDVIDERGRKGWFASTLRKVREQQMLAARDRREAREAAREKRATETTQVA